MSEAVSLSLELSGGTADEHQFNSYDGYMSLAGFAWTLALTTNYLETGVLRHRGQFVGRELVTSSPMRRGSIIADYLVTFSADWAKSTGLVAGVASSAVLISLVSRVIARNLGQATDLAGSPLANLIHARSGDVEALVAQTEAPIRQAHSVIGNGALEVRVVGGHNLINTFTPRTKDYVSGSFEDDEIWTRNVSVASFNVNSGSGSVFDFELNRIVSIRVPRNILAETRGVFTWGLDQYANRRNEYVEISFFRTLALDRTPKRYNIVSARRL